MGSPNGKMRQKPERERWPSEEVDRALKKHEKRPILREDVERRLDFQAARGPVGPNADKRARETKKLADVNKRFPPERVCAQNRCPDCGGPLIQNYARGEVVCGRCGLVVDRVFDYGPEWRAFNQEQAGRRSRVGPPLTPAIHDRGLTTTIDSRNCDASGHGFTPERRAQMYRLRRWQRRTRISSSSDRNLSQAFDKINRIASQLGLPKSIREKATVIYRRAAKKGLVRGRSIDGVATAAIYIACRLLGFSRTLHELKKASGISKTTIIARDCKFLKQKLNLHLPAASPDEYVPRIGSNLGLSGEAQCKAAELIRKMRERGTASGRSPVTVAAAAVYIASLQADEPQTEREVAKAASVSEISVRTGKNEICRKISIKIPKIAGRR